MHKNSLRIALAQINTIVGDLVGNKNLILKTIQQCQQDDVDLVIFPELTLTGYPPEDLLFMGSFIRENIQCLHEIARHTPDVVAVVGFVDQHAHQRYNAAAMLYQGQVLSRYYKIALPNYGVFDEKRYFTPGEELVLLELAGIKIGVTICEDIWSDLKLTEHLVFRGGAEMLVNLSASPYYLGKGNERERLLSGHALNQRVICAYTNLVGGQDELVFDGQSFLFDEAGEIVEQGKAFREDLILVDIDVTRLRNIRRADPNFQKPRPPLVTQYRLNQIQVPHTPDFASRSPLPIRKLAEASRLGEIYQALVLGTRDYTHKNGFKKIVLGLSGGIDSALCAIISADALGKDNVVGVAMPSRYSAEISLNDARELAHNLGIQFLEIPIQATFAAYNTMLKPVFQDLAEDITEENIQARIRGNIIMALSNKFGWLPVATGNKSEVSVGYCTLYGDMAGGFAIIKDVPKTLVYQLARHRNAYGGVAVIPQRTIARAPSAELRPNQLDEDSLPPYPILDPILAAYIEQDFDMQSILQLGYPSSIVGKVLNLVDQNEYKRRQSAPGIKISPRAFGKDRRMPITNRYRQAVGPD